MRYLIVVILVLTCMVATIRIDGAWSPAMMAEHVESALVKVIAPGKALLSGLEERFGPRRHPPSRGAWDIRVALPSVMAGASATTIDHSSSCG